MPSAGRLLAILFRPSVIRAECVPLAKRFEKYVTRLIAIDRRGVPKGMVDIVI